MDAPNIVVHNQAGFHSVARTILLNEVGNKLFYWLDHNTRY